MAFYESLSARPVSFGDLFSNGRRYCVPNFQRDYAWTEDECGELWQDILALEPLPGHASHFLGAIVLQPGSSPGEQWIIDGQQRLVTLSLLSLAVLRRLDGLIAEGVDPDGNTKRRRLLKERFVSVQSPVSLREQPRLRLNEQDDGFYSGWLVQNQTPPRRLAGSHKRLQGATTFFERRLAERFPSSLPDAGVRLSAFLDEVVASRLRLIQIDVTDDETAFTVFETLNARGVALGPADLLKNFLFAKVAKGGAEDLRQAERLWRGIVERVSMESVSTLVFHHLASQLAEVRERRVFPLLRGQVSDPATAFQLLQVLDEKAHIAEALDNPEHDDWADLPGVGRRIRALGVWELSALRPLLFVAIPLLQSKPEELVRLLDQLLVTLLRARVSHVNTGDIQRAVHAAARGVATGALRRPRSIVQALSPMRVDDDRFVASFSVAAWSVKRNRKIVQFLLAELERQAGGAIDFATDEVTIEHILPQNPGGAYDEFRDPDAFVDRLGNLTPLERTLNRRLGATLDWGEKRSAYAESRYRLTQAVVAEAWSPEAVQARQARMAELARARWALPVD